MDSYFDTSEFFKTYAAMKNIPIEKVIRNMGRDFSAAAYRATPLMNRNGKWRNVGVLELPSGIRYFSIEKYLVTHKSRKAKSRLNGKNGSILHRLKPSAGWSLASWFGVFSDLGMETSKPGKRARGSVVRHIGDAVIGFQTESATCDIMIDISLSGSPGRKQQILDYGRINCTKAMVRDFCTIVRKRKWQ